MAVMSSSTQYRIVSGAQLPNFMGKNISICGFVKTTAAGKSYFVMNTTDNLMVTVKLSKPLEEDISGYVEVRGTCELSNEGKVIKATEFFTFSNESFDAKNHNMLCKIINSVPNVYSIKKN